MGKKDPVFPYLPRFGIRMFLPKSYVGVENTLNKLEVCGENFSFNGSYYTKKALGETRHNFELEESDYTVLCLDAKMSGIGSGSCGPHLLEKYRVAEDKLVFDMTLKAGKR